MNIKWSKIFLLIVIITSSNSFVQGMNFQKLKRNKYVQWAQEHPIITTSALALGAYLSCTPGG